MNAIDFLANVSRPKTPEWVNDSEDHAAVMKMFDRAIELAEKEECK
jgi:hypothetical protein